MTREEARKILESGGSVSYHVWWFSKQYMSCSEGCCDDSYSSTEETLDAIEHYTGGDWSKVEDES